MTTEQHYDAIVIGSGQGGKPLAGALAGAGHKTAIIEREHVGGSCVNVGCTPTKTMIASARAAYVDRRSADYGIHNGSVTVEMTEVRQRKRDIVDKFRDGVRQIIESTKGLDLFLGEARFTGPKELEVDLNNGETIQLTADNIFINVGAQPMDPPIEGWTACLPWTPPRSWS